MIRLFLYAGVPLSLLVGSQAQARTVHRCTLDGSVSLSTAAEPDSRCTVLESDDSSAKPPNLWGSVGMVQSKLYQREQDGRMV